MNAKIFLGGVLLASMSSAADLLIKDRREISFPSEIQHCINDAQPFLDRIRGYVLECKTNKGPSDLSGEEADKDTTKTDACLTKRIDEDTEGLNQIQGCYRKMYELPSAQGLEAEIFLERLAEEAMGISD